jgi:hypothetical protein
MILIQITNSSEFLASKIGKFLESLTPASFDVATVEDRILRELIGTLAAEGLHGEVATVQGLELDCRENGSELVLSERMRVRQHQSF